MKYSIRKLYAAGAAVCVLALSAQGSDRVEVESKTIGFGGSSTVGVYLENDADLRSVVVTLVVREITPGSYMTAWTPRYNSDARLHGFLTEPSYHLEYPTEDGNCKNGNPGGFGTQGSADFVSPDGVLFSRSRIFGPHLPPGSDFPIGVGEPSIEIDLTVTPVEGTLEIDTTCMDPNNHLMYLTAPGFPVYPSFTKGVITILGDPCPVISGFGEDTVTAVSGELATNTTLAFDPDPPTPGGITYCLVAGPGTVNPVSGDWVHTPSCDEGPVFEVTVGVGDGDSPCPCSEASFHVFVEDYCDDRVVLESKHVGKNGTTTVGLFLSNSVTVRVLRLPFAIRELTPGSFMTDWHTTFNVAGRLSNHLRDYREMRAYPVDDGTCISTFPGFGTKGPFDFVSPDGVYFLIAAEGSPTEDLPPGSDFYLGEPAMHFEISVTGTPGTFEIDTTCTDPSNHLLFERPIPLGSVTPQFTKSIITITDCTCPLQVEYDEDGFPTLVDYNGLLDVLFSGAEDPQDPECPATRSDFDCDGFPTALDLSWMAEYLFGGGPGPCDPCTCDPYPDNCP